MFFLLSGEGPTDIGVCREGRDECDADEFDCGPMTLLVDQIVQSERIVSLVEASQIGAVSKARLEVVARGLRPPQNRPSLPGLKRPTETLYFYRNARALASCTRAKEAEKGCAVVAILFRDSDGTASAGRGLWQDKWDSMIRGFEAEGFASGVPMIPRPKSEVWFLCAMEELNARGCAARERDAPGNDNSPNSLKKQLADRCGGRTTREDLCEWVRENENVAVNLPAPSFVAFRERLVEVIRTDR